MRRFSILIIIDNVENTVNRWDLSIYHEVAYGYHEVAYGDSAAECLLEGIQACRANYPGCAIKYEHAFEIAP